MTLGHGSSIGVEKTPAILIAGLVSVGVAVGVVELGDAWLPHPAMNVTQTQNSVSTHRILDLNAIPPYFF